MHFTPLASGVTRFLRQSLRIAAAAALLLVGPPAAADAASDRTALQIQALLAEKASRTPAQRKMDSQLLQAARESRGQPMAAGVSLAPIAPATDVDGRVLLDVDVVSAAKLDPVVGQIEDLGGEIVHPSWDHRTIRARLPLSASETLAGSPDVTFVKFAVRSMTAAPGRLRTGLAQRAAVVRNVLSRVLASGRVALTGTVNSQGDRTHRADDARNTYGYSGQGVRIGVLSDSYNALGVEAADIASGNLPGPGNPLGNTTPVTVLADDPGGSDEGRAMLQIVHDLAPKAQLFFATADVSEASFASNIVALRNPPYNCDIVIDDVFYFDEPVFQDGIVAQAVNVVTASGGLYFSSAGNEGNVAKGTAGYFEGDFNDAGSPAFTFPGGAKTGTIHNFGTVGSPVNGDIITAAGFAYTLNWSDPAGASANDYDLFLVSSTGTVKGSSTNVQSGTQNPFEIISAPALAAGDRLVVFKTAAAAVRAFAINTLRGSLTVKTTGQTHGHSSAASAFSVAAAPAVSPGPYPSAFGAASPVETFSSDGPRRIFFNADGTPVTPGNLLFGTNGGTVRSKPDLTAADGVSTTLPGTSGLNPFYGTSAAAPHAGAIAGLLKSANPALTAAQIRAILTTTAVDIESAGWDNVSGVGIVQAYQAMQSVAPTPQASLILGTTTATEGAFSNGNGAIEPGESATLIVQLQNPSLVAATPVNATLTSATPGVTVSQGTASYGTIAAGGNATNGATPFVFGVASTVPCGTPITLVLTVTLGGGPSPQVFNVPVSTGAVPGASISANLASGAATGTGFTSSSGVQTGRLNRFAVVSTCAAPTASPGIFSATGARAYHAYTFTNTGTAAQCITVTLTTANSNLFTVAYGPGGFNPASPGTNYLADPGVSGAVTSYSFTAPAGQAFTVVVHEVNPGAGLQSYSLGVSLAVCASTPACSAVSITTASLASGTVGTAYSQALAASGGSGAYAFSIAGSLPTGLALLGSSITGTPLQPGTFPLTVTATDAAGCGAPSKALSLTTSCPALLPLVVTAASPVAAGSTGNLASVASIAGVTYAWSIVNGTITAGQGTNQITFAAGSAGTTSVSVTLTTGSCFRGGGFANVAVTSGGLSFYVLTPCRAVDTRGPNAPSIAASGSPDRPFAVAGTCGIPSDAKAIAANVAVVSPAAAGSLLVYRGDGSATIASMISFVPGRTRAAQALVQLALDASGTVKVNNQSAGTLDLIVDVGGYFK